MDSKRIFGGSIPLLSKALDLRSQKHNVIVSNIANVDTPDYKAFRMHVEEALEKGRGTSGSLQLNRTSRSHLPVGRRDAAGARITRESTSGHSLRGDGNTVDPDRSMSRMAENSLLYNTAAQILNKKLQGLKAVIQGGSGGK